MVVVPQEPTIVSGTIADNITLGTEVDEGDAAVERAAREAGHDSLLTLPQGINTEIGEGVQMVSALKFCSAAN